MKNKKEILRPSDKIARVDYDKMGIKDYLIAVGVVETMSVMMEHSGPREYKSWFSDNPFIDFSSVSLDWTIDMHMRIDPNISGIVDGFPFHKSIQHAPVLILSTKSLRDIG